jgi:predicted RNase H-like nuclease (RuvC/YqgF family)
MAMTMAHEPRRGGGGGGGGPSGGVSPLEFAKLQGKASELEALYSSASQQNAELQRQLAALRERAAGAAAQAAKERAAERERVAELEERLSEMEVSMQVRGGGCVLNRTLKHKK